ncbi:MAG TPA: hypothetical protein PLF01_07400 [Alphaproteobacteria bacterium]|nr:hypothetical protein [Alphaproteobacteria bacterium]
MTLSFRSAFILFTTAVITLTGSMSKAHADDQECDYMDTYINSVVSAPIHNGGGVWRAATFSMQGDFWLLVEHIDYNNADKYDYESIEQATLTEAKGSSTLPFENAASVVIKDMKWESDDFRAAENALDFTLSYIGTVDGEKRSLTAACKIPVGDNGIGKAACTL